MLSFGQTGIQTDRKKDRQTPVKQYEHKNSQDPFSPDTTM